MFSSVMRGCTLIQFNGSRVLSQCVVHVCKPYMSDGMHALWKKLCVYAYYNTQSSWEFSINQFSHLSLSYLTSISQLILQLSMNNIWSFPILSSSPISTFTLKILILVDSTLSIRPCQFDLVNLALSILCCQFDIVNSTPCQFDLPIN